MKSLNKSNIYSSSYTNKSLSDNCSINKILNFDFIKKQIILIADDNHIINDAHKKLLSIMCKEKQLDYEIINTYPNYN